MEGILQDAAAVIIMVSHWVLSFAARLFIQQQAHGSAVFLNHLKQADQVLVVRANLSQLIHKLFINSTTGFNPFDFLVDGLFPLTGFML